MALLITPSQIVTASFAASISVPLFLIALSRGPFLIRDLKMRFRFSSLFAVGFWAALMLFGDEFWRLDTNAIGDALAGALIVLSAILTTLIIWMLVATGVSINLLASLSSRPEPVEIEPWLADYGDGYGAEDVFRDRLNLLLSTRAAVLRQSTVLLARRARLSVILLEAGMLYFNFSKSTDG